MQKCFELASPIPAALPRQLPPIRDTIQFIEAKQYLDVCGDPIFKSLAMQSLYEDMGGVKALPQSKEEDLVLAAVLARGFGYKLEPGQDAQLGKFVRRYREPTGKVQQGKYEVNAYPRHVIEETVHAFFR